MSKKEAPVQSWVNVVCPWLLGAVGWYEYSCTGMILFLLGKMNIMIDQTFSLITDVFLLAFIKKQAPFYHHTIFFFFLVEIYCSVFQKENKELS